MREPCWNQREVGGIPALPFAWRAHWRSEMRIDVQCRRSEELPAFQDLVLEGLELLGGDEPFVEPAGELDELAAHRFRIERFPPGVLDQLANRPDRDACG